MPKVNSYSTASEITRDHPSILPFAENDDNLLPWASCQMRKIEGCACTGNAGKSLAAKKFPAFPAHAQHAILRIWKEAHGSS